MQVLFCHDGPIRIDEMEKYYGIAHNNDLFGRYFAIADKVATVIRVEKLKKHKKRYSQIDIENFKVYEIENLNSIKGILRRNKISQQIYKAVKESDYIIARLPSFIGNLAIKHAKKLKKPYLTEVVACPWDALWNHSLKGKLVAPHMFLKTKKLVRNSNHVIYVTKNFLQNRYPTKGESVNCSNVVLKDINDDVMVKRLEKIKTKPIDEKIIIGTTAAINVRYKGQQYIIEALGRLKEQGITNYEYQLVGAGDQTYLRNIAKKYDVEKSIKFLGPKKHAEVFKWLDTIDIYAQPSRQEGLPRALIEAMSRGLPAMGANTAGIPELISNKYIFSNSKTNIREINDILTILTKNMIVESERNFVQAKQYADSVISERRKHFYIQFRNKQSR